MVRIIVWDADGTLFYDEGKNYDQPAKLTPLFELLKLLRISDTYNILVTGRTEIEVWLREYFDEVHCREFPTEPYNTYYSRYWQWKINTILGLKLKPALVFDDDQQICRALLAKNIGAVWVPQNSYMNKPEVFPQHIGSAQ